MIDRLHVGWQKNYNHAHSRNPGGCCGQMLSTGGHFITLAVQPGCRSLIERFEGNDSYTQGYSLSSLAENPQLLSQSFFRSFSVWNNNGVIELNYQSTHKMFSTWINNFLKPGYLQISISRMLYFVQSAVLLNA